MMKCIKNVVEINGFVEKMSKCGHKIISKHMNGMWKNVLEYSILRISSWTIWRTVNNEFKMQLLNIKVLYIFRKWYFERYEQFESSQPRYFVFRHLYTKEWKKFGKTHIWFWIKVWQCTQLLVDRNN